MDIGIAGNVVAVSLTSCTVAHLVDHTAGRQVQFALTQVEISTAVDTATFVYTCTKVTIIAGFTVLFQYDVHDTCTTAGSVIFGTRSGHYFHAFDCISRDLIEGEGSR